MVCRRGGRRPGTRQDVGLDHATLDDLSCGRSDRLGVELVLVVGAGAVANDRAQHAPPDCDLREVAASIRRSRPDLVWLIADGTCPRWHLHAVAGIASRAGAQVLVVRSDDEDAPALARTTPSGTSPSGTADLGSLRGE